jgi:hypothetical protein
VPEKSLVEVVRGESDITKNCEKLKMRSSTENYIYLYMYLLDRVPVCSQLSFQARKRLENRKCKI